MRSFLIFSIILLINSIQGNALKCNLRSGGQGFCMPVKNCNMCQYPNFVFYPDHFCPGDFSLICCDMTVPPPNRISITTTRAPLPPPSNIRSYENHQSYKLFDMEKCGSLKSDVKIANGDVAQVLEFPWNVLIGYDHNSNGKIAFDCGGTLISSKLRNLNI